MTDREITFESLAEDEQAPLDRLSKVIDAIDLASDQDQATWITAESRRIAKIAPVDEIPDGLLRRITEDEITRLAASELDELLEFAGQIRAAMRTTRDAYDALFGASGARLLRAGQPQYVLHENQAVLFCRALPDAGWEPGTFIRYQENGGRALVSDASGQTVLIDRFRVVAAVPADLGRTLAAKRAETGPVWRAAVGTGLTCPHCTTPNAPGCRWCHGCHRDMIDGLRAATEPVWRAAAETGPDLPGKLSVSRGLLIQVLTDAGLDAAKAETVWDVLGNLTHGIHPDGNPVGWPPAPDNAGTDRQGYEGPNCGSTRPHGQHMHSPIGGMTLNCPGVRPGGPFDHSGRPEHAAPSKVTPRGPLTLEVVSDALSLAGVSVRMETLAEWTFAQRVDAYDWAIREHLHASDNVIARADRPPFIPGPEN